MKKKNKKTYRETYQFSLKRFFQVHEINKQINTKKQAANQVILRHITVEATTKFLEIMVLFVRLSAILWGGVRHQQLKSRSRTAIIVPCPSLHSQSHLYWMESLFHNVFTIALHCKRHTAGGNCSEHNRPNHGKQTANQVPYSSTLIIRTMTERIIGSQVNPKYILIA